MKSAKFAFLIRAYGLEILIPRKTKIKIFTTMKISYVLEIWAELMQTSIYGLRDVPKISSFEGGTTLILP